MSEHRIEDLVAESIRLLDDHTASGDPRVRDWFAKLYGFQDGFDCSFTHFRVRDILLRRGYAYRFPLDRHPDHEDGYVDPPFLYCDAGTDLWRRMVSAGELRGPDADPPRRTPLIDVVREIAVAAEKSGDHELVGEWYAFGCETLLGGPAGCPFDVDELADMPAVRDLRAVVRRTDTLAVARRSPYASPVECADDNELAAWWWRL
ncbi:hypothetical protein F9278_44235 [Streptomyces phaeolivaceus]|uniref:Uncharacterized protein n=1 Tax=Streptomyces phaeolivaceus TaxID=2653200 RepID=A0A5P8KG84_9ACTN|nr:hypothetical protein [Streptomyces phaeolivaceus]QFR02027.1 hypothetical protein F9278_44235 [Streptomyces phaeolivaceus]